jgi:transposase
MGQQGLFKDTVAQDKNIISIGHRLYLKFHETDQDKVALFHHDVRIKSIDLSDKVAKRLFIVEAVELGATKSRLAKALQISRQTIDNYLGSKEHFGSEGLINNYAPGRSKSLRRHREENQSKRNTGNKARQLEEIRKQEREKQLKQGDLTFGEPAKGVEPEDQPFFEPHDWQATRHAGVFVYLIALIHANDWLRLIMVFFGDKYKVFMVFVLMVAGNIRSIEQLKNIQKREAGLILGIGRLPSRLKARSWLYLACKMQAADRLLASYFLQQVRKGIVGVWLWFTDGHLLPYTGQNKVHQAYNTQRSMMVAGRTSMVTCDGNGKVVDFEIQEGKGDLRNYLIELGKKWKKELPEMPVMVFDREGHGCEFFYNMIQAGIPFVTWEKNTDKEELDAIKEERFELELKVNGKFYRIFEEEKKFSYCPENDERHTFSLRRIVALNMSTNHRFCVLSSLPADKMSTQECAYAILSRWGASENTFKHLGDRHPLNYQPGYQFTESENQEIANPEIKETNRIISKVKTKLARLYKKLSKSKEVLNKDGSVRLNSTREKLLKEIQDQEAEISQLHQAAKALPERVDVSELEDYRCFKRICEESKNLFDFVTSSVWNVRKQMAQWLLPLYENKNEYVDLFYAITNCHGWIKSDKNSVLVRLEPFEQPSRRAAQQQLCRKLTELGAVTPMGKWLKIEVGKSPLN